jgi:hypothetical protein
MLGIALSFPTADLQAHEYDRRASATITSVENISDDDGPDFRIGYVFRDEHGVERRGRSFSTHEAERTLEAESGSPWRAHDVEYESGSPSRSRLVGLDSGRGGPYALLVLLFPITFVIPALLQLRRGLRERRLLRYGVETHGVVVGKQHSPQTALTFEYASNDGVKHRVVITTENEPLLEDDELEPMLYDPFAQHRATTLDHLPGKPIITSDGQIMARPGFAVHVLIAPLACVVLAVVTIAEKLL